MQVDRERRRRCDLSPRADVDAELRSDVDREWITGAQRKDRLERRCQRRRRVERMTVGDVERRVRVLEVRRERDGNELATDLQGARETPAPAEDGGRGE